jgi:hypothetical protein
LANSSRWQAAVVLVENCLDRIGISGVKKCFANSIHNLDDWTNQGVLVIFSLAFS